MKGTLVNLNVNPCKMCMPMGAVTAFYGIKGSMSILHGSQGCSTYIRRHMATHYHEPVDIASSSLTEEGTVYGGEQNLISGIHNLIRLYHPEVIAVETTCLAETIGEDIERIVEKFYQLYPQMRHVYIISVPTAGYAGTQFEGYMKALSLLVRQVKMDTQKNNRINVVTSLISPADTRYLKELLNSFGLDYILLPDISQNLDGGYQKEYNRLPQGGTDVNEIRKMGGARYTVEISAFSKDNPSVAQYLYDTYGVPYQRCNIPVSLRDNDTLIELLSQLSGKAIPSTLQGARARFLDAMIDAHKINTGKKTAVYGEPDFVYSTVRFLVENGILPSIVATGSVCKNLKEMLENEWENVSGIVLDNEIKVLDDIDFQTIQQYAEDLNIDLFIGNSDGRRIAERLDRLLVRRGFPIHDRIGGQRLRMIGYEGACLFLDDISNALLARKEEGFRKQLYNQYYHALVKRSEDSTPTVKTIDEKTATHPCFSPKAHEYARMHLPIAPECNIQCNYCVRKFDCPNESRPGVTTSVYSPGEALERFIEAKKNFPNLTVVGIAGPGDALANFGKVKKTLQAIREKDQNITFCLSTNGLLLPQYADELATIGVSHVTVTLNAVDTAIGAKIYGKVSFKGQTFHGEEAAAILLSNQLEGIKMAVSAGMVLKVNIVMIKGINDSHVPEVVRTVKQLGGTMTNIMRMIPVEGSTFENLPLVEEQELIEMRLQCRDIMKQMLHCRQCRSDAIGKLGEDSCNAIKEKCYG